MGKKLFFVGCLIIVTIMVVNAFALENSPVPKVAISQMSKSPVIDGVISPGEWDSAAAVTGFQVLGGYKLLPLQPIVYIGYDQKNLYICFQGPVTPDRRTPRSKDRDSEVYNDDSFELWLNPNFDTHDGLHKGYYQMIGNTLGTIYDVLYKPGIGQTYVGWNGEWQFKNTVFNDIWTAEIAITFQELDVETPQPETRWNVNFCRDFPGWYKFTSWSPATNFSNISTMGEIVFLKDIPVVQVLSLGNLGEGNLDARFIVYQHVATDAMIKAICQIVDATGNILLSEERDIKATSGKRTEFSLTGAFTSQPGVTIKVEVSGSGGTPLYHAFTVPAAVASKPTVQTEKPAKIHTGYFPYSGWVKARVELGTKLSPEDVKEITMTLYDTKGNKPIAMAEAGPFKEYTAVARTNVGELSEGEYSIVVTLKGKDGETIYEEEQSYERKKFSWEHNRLGISDTIVSPFTPIKSDGNKFSVLLREYTIGEAGFPIQITAAGKEIMSKPFCWSAQINGRKFTLEEKSMPMFGKQSRHEASWEGKTKLGDLEISTVCTLEYDGMIRTEITLNPIKPVDIERLTLEIPINKETGKFLSAWTSGYPRWNGKIPETEDFDVAAWQSKEMQQRHIRGTFVPLIWIGNDERGFYWFANSDQGWMLDDEKSCQEVVHRYKSVVLLIHFINKKVRLASDRKIIFGMMATPVKMFPEGWRAWFAPSGSSLEGANKMVGIGGNWPGLMGVYGFGTIEPEWTRKWVEGHRKGPDSKVAAYMSLGNMPLNQPEYKTFKAEWVGLKPPVTEFNEYYLTAKPGEYPYFPSLTKESVTGVNTDLTQSAIDIRVWEWKRLIEKAGLNGGYWDGPILYPTAFEPETGGAYISDDGVVHPVYRFFEARQLHKRVTTLHQELGVPPFHIAHSTGGVALPAISFMQVVLGGEDPGMQGGKSPDLLDVWKFDRYRTELGKQWGMPPWVLIMTHTEPDVGYGCDPAPTRSGIALCLLHDTIPCVAWGNPHIAKRVADVKAEFGITENDVVFIPYWKNKVLSSNPDIKVSVYRRPKRALIVPVNIGKEGVYQTLDLGNLDLGTIFSAKDGETGEDLTPCIMGSKMTFFVARHDFRMVLLE